MYDKRLTYMARLKSILEFHSPTGSEKPVNGGSGKALVLRAG